MVLLNSEVPSQFPQGVMNGGENQRGEPSPMERMPFLILQKNFIFLPSSDRQNCTKVCQRWKEIIMNDVGVTRHVGNGSYNFPRTKSVEWLPSSVIEQDGIDRCIFGDVETGLLKPFASWVAPELVREIAFYGRIENFTFHHLMDPVHWLNTLKIHLTVFLTVSFENPISWKLCNLRQLCIFYTHPVYQLLCPFTSTDVNGSMRRDVVHRNLINFLDNSFFRRLKEFEFVGPYFIEKTKQLIETIQDFVRKHEGTLKALILSFPYEWSVEGRNSMDGFLSGESKKGNSFWGLPQLTKILIACPNNVVPPILVRHGDDMDILWETRREEESSWSQKTLNPLWKSLIETQLHLEVLQYLNKFEEWPFPSDLFKRNGSHLREVSICIKSNHQVDFRSLEECKTLRKLALEGNGFFSEEWEREREVWDREEDQNKHLVNLHLLPPSIQEISLSKLFVPREELEIFLGGEVKPFPCLKIVQLYQISKGLPRFGLSIKAIEYLLKRSQVSFSFWQALNKTTIQEALGKWQDRKNSDQNQETDHACDDNDDDGDVNTLKKMLELTSAYHEVVENLQFGTLNDCLVKRVAVKDELKLN